MPSYITREILIQFAGETNDIAQEAARLLIKLERADDAQLKGLLDSLARAMHTLKGTAAAVGFDKAATLAHALESLLQPHLTQRSRPSQELVDVFLQALDLVTELAKTVEADQPPPDAAMAMLTEQVRARLASASASTSAPAPAPAPRPTVPVPPPLSVRPAPLPDPSPSPSAGPQTLSGLRPAPRPSLGGAVDGGGDGEASGTLRVQSTRVDAVLSGAEELHSLRSRIEARRRESEALADAAAAALRMAVLVEGMDKKLVDQLRAVRRLTGTLAASLAGDAQASETLTQSLGDDIRALRTVPAAALLDVLERGARDHARKEGKEVDFVLDGRAVEVDRVLLAELRGPLLHLLRNAVDHGLEAPLVRTSRGKAARGQIAVRLQTAGEMLRVVVEDDGAGVDLEWVRRRAVELERMTDAQARAASDGALEELLFAPGFSTSTKVTETSGRGVGLDVVRETVTRLRGSLKLEAHPERGTRFTLFVPLAVTATHALLVRVRQHRFAIPSHSIKWIRQVPRDDVRVIRGEANVPDGTVLVPLDRLAASVGLLGPSAALGPKVAVVALAGNRTAAFVVDDYDDEIDVIAKPLPKELQTLRGLAGVALLGSGESVLLLNPDTLIQGATGKTGLPDPGAGAGRFTVLVVDDSATTRLLHQVALEAEGFRVVCASDGDEALRMLTTVSCDVVVSDVRMPRVSGLQLARAIRDDPKTKSLPVVLCSSVDVDELGPQVAASGATAALPKSSWARGTLASTLRDLLAAGGRK